MSEKRNQCSVCETTDDAEAGKCPRRDCPYRCDPVLSEWDAELVATEGEAIKP